MSPIAVVALGLLGVVALVRIVQRCLTYHSIKHIQSPPSPSWLFGHSHVINRQVQVGDLDFQYVKDYGTVWRTKGCLGEDILVVADPKALQHICHKSGYHYPKSVVARVISRCLTGESILITKAGDHQRHRKIMNPAFTAPQLRTFLPLFHRSAAKLGQMWKDKLQAATSETESVINIHSWLANMTLDVIGDAAFEFQCGALDNSGNELSDAYKNMFADLLLYPSKMDTLFKSLWRFLPDAPLRYVDYLPMREYKRFRSSLSVINKVSKQLIDEKTEAYVSGKNNQKDIMSILVKANTSEDPGTQLSDIEMISQMATFLLAGHDTTANTLTWTFWELAQNPEYQSKVREEVSAIRAKVAARGATEFSVADLDAMTYTLAAMKETLRLDPIVYALNRVAGQDDVIPLSHPVLSTTGEWVSAIPVSKGQSITLNICTYNRLKSVWGEDADVWNPYRFLDTDKEKQQVNVGVFANLMTFSGGLRGCIGWRFSVLEMQAILVDLIETFEFSIPDDPPDIIRAPAGLMIPLIRDNIHLGSQMPLKVSLLH